MKNIFLILFLLVKNKVIIDPTLEPYALGSVSLMFFSQPTCIFFEISSHKEIFTWIESGSIKIKWSKKIEALT